MKRSLSVGEAGSCAIGTTQRKAQGLALVGFGKTLAALFLLASGSASFAAELDSPYFTVQPPSNKEPLLRVDFYLPESDPVQGPIKVTANGASLRDSKITQIDEVPDYSVAVLLVVDNTLGNRQGTDQKAKETILNSVRSCIRNFTSSTVAATPATTTAPVATTSTTPSSSPSSSVSPAPARLFKFEIATVSDGNINVLASMGSSKELLERATRALRFDGGSPQLYLELKKAVERLSQVQANRKFIVVFSDGVSNDDTRFASAIDVISAALRAEVHICSIAFPTAEDSNVAQGLDILAEKTGGTSVQAKFPDLQQAKTKYSEPLLPKETEDSFLKLMTSGGQFQVDLGGASAPVTLTFSIQTQFLRNYFFRYTIDSLPVVPPPSATTTPVVSSPPFASPNPAVSLKSSATPTPMPSSSPQQSNSWLIQNLAVVIAVAALLIAAGVLLIIFALKKSHRPVEFSMPNQTTLAGDIIGPSEVDRPPMAWLESLDGEQTRYPISKSAVRIGRKADNDIIMKNDTVSGHHAEILVRGSEFIITDLGSSNQVFVGGRAIERTALQDGDIIELGEVRLRFLQPHPTDHNYRTKVIS